MKWEWDFVGASETCTLSAILEKEFLYITSLIKKKK